LLHHIANYELPAFPTHLRVIHVEQESSPEAKTVLQVVLEADVERHLLLAEETRLKKILENVDGNGDVAAEEKEVEEVDGAESVELQVRSMARLVMLLFFLGVLYCFLLKKSTVPRP
jgi:hypothetical protein